MSLASCTHVSTPDIEGCAVAGRMAAGASCTTTVSDSRRRLDLKEFIEFLEPNQEQQKGPAICMASSSFAAYRTAFEQLCAKARISCTKKVKETFEKAAKAVHWLERQSFDAVAVENSKTLQSQ